MKITTINQKGGVGKTTTTINLAACLAELGASVLVIDLDPQGNTSAMLRGTSTGASVLGPLLQLAADKPGVSLASVVIDTPIPRVKLIPAEADLATLDWRVMQVPGHEGFLRELLDLGGFSSQFDYILLDNTPAPGLLGPRMGLIAADLALVPVQCEDLSLDGLSQFNRTIGQARRVNRALQRRILLTMHHATRYSANEAVNDVREFCPGEVFETVISESAELTRGRRNFEVGGAIIHYASDNRAATQYRALAREVTALNPKANNLMMSTRVDSSLRHA